MEIMASSLIAASVPDSGSYGVVRTSAAADAGASARFVEIMETGVVAQSGTLAPASIDSGMAPAGANSLGDRILNGISSASSDFQTSLKTVSSLLEGGNVMSASDLLKLQLNLVQVSIQYDLIGKAISRSTQNIDQMVKIQ